MLPSELRPVFTAWLQERYPNDSNVSSTVSGAFFADRRGTEVGLSFAQILAQGIVPDDYKQRLEAYFIQRGRKNPAGDASIYVRSLRLLFECMKDIVLKKEHILVRLGKDRFAQQSGHPWVHLTGNKAYDTVLNDIVGTPHAFVLACLMDRQIKAERAWAIPCILMGELGTDINALNAVSEEKYATLFSQHRLHRFNNEMAKTFKSGVQRIVDEYGGDASRIWKGNPCSAKVVYEFLQFRGAGIKIATMAANILARQFKIAFADYYSIDVSPDVHIRRVMWRMGLIEDENNTDAVIYRARELNPEFPGIIDFTMWEIGKDICRPTNPRCDRCAAANECSKRLK